MANNVMDQMAEASDKLQKGVTFMGTISSALSMAWNAIWYGGIIALVGWIAYQIPEVRPYMDKAIDWLKGQEWGAGLLEMINQFAGFFGMEPPFPDAIPTAVGTAVGNQLIAARETPLKE